MLYYKTVDELTLNLLREIQTDSRFNEFLLVGGTALALQIGHRISIDLDLFQYSDENISKKLDSIRDFGDITILNKTDRILNLRINDIKVDFVSYHYPFIGNVINTDRLRLASLEDIAAMKLSAITGRGTRKDFIDLFFLLQSYSFSEIISFFEQKFPDTGLFQVHRSLTYFDDAELEPMPYMLTPTEWEDVKSTINSEVKSYFQ